MARHVDTSAGEGPPVLLEVSDQVGRITLNRPRLGNALDFALADTLAQIIDRCGADEDIRCVLLTGAGRFFCVGGDIGLMSQAGDKIGETLSRLATSVHQAIEKLVLLPKPLVTVVNGPAAGAGFSLALYGDICLAAKSASFTPAYGRVGLTPDGGMSWMLPRIVGFRRAQELLATNRSLSAEEAQTCQVVTHVVPDEHLQQEGERQSALLAQGPIEALVQTRMLLFESCSTTLAAHLEAEAKAIGQAGASAEGREGIAAFLDKRPPQFA